VVLADGTVIDGTWGQIYPGGANYPVHSERERRVFAAPTGAVDATQAEQGAHAASRHLNDPEAISELRRQAADTQNQPEIAAVDVEENASGFGGEENLAPARRLGADEIGTFYDSDGNAIAPGTVRDAADVHPDDLVVGDRIMYRGYEMTVQSTDGNLHLMADVGMHSFPSAEEFIRYSQGDAAADYYASDEAKTAPILRTPEPEGAGGSEATPRNQEEGVSPTVDPSEEPTMMFRRPGADEDETSGLGTGEAEQEPALPREDLDKFHQAAIGPTYASHLEQEHLRAFQAEQLEREQRIIQGVAEDWEALPEPERLAALEQARRAFPALTGTTAEDLNRSFEHFKNDGEFSSVVGPDGGVESAYSIVNFVTMLTEAPPIPDGPLIRVSDNAYDSFGDTRVNDDGERLKAATYATPAGAVYDGRAVLDLSPDEYARRMGIVDGSEWAATSELLNQYMTSGRLEGETDRDVRRRWEAEVERSHGGFTQMNYMSVTLDAASLGEKIRYSAPHLSSGYSEVTMRPLDAAEFAGLGMLNIPLSADQTLGESLRNHLSAELIRNGKPDLADQVMLMTPAELADVIKTDVADPEKMRSHLGG